METCGICHSPIDGPQLGEPGAPMHPACLADRLPQDAMAALGGLLALVLAPAILIWAA
jgi:hypothetical protein